MNTHTPISIFRAGRHVDQSGASLEFTEADLLATSKGYDPALHEAPLVIGHPTHDAPAYGWVQTLSLHNGTLRAHPKQVDDEFSRMVAKGRFKKISASFYLPDAPRNPCPGIFYLRHVGFLGAQPPAVKGLPDAAFSDDDDRIITLDFNEPNDPASSKIWERLRLWIAARFGQDEAEAAIPRASLATPPSTPEALPPINATEALLHAHAARLQQAESNLRQQQHLRFVESMVRSGRILPRDEPGLLTLLSIIPNKESLAFGEEEPSTPLNWFQAWVTRLPPQVDYSERAAPSPETNPAHFPVPAGFEADPAMLDIHQRAIAYAQRHHVDYRSAVDAVLPT